MKSLSVLKTNWSRTSARNHKQDTLVANLVLNIHGLKFERYGMYRIDFAIDGNIKASLPLRVREVPSRTQ